MLLPLTPQTDAKYLKSYCKSASYCRFTVWLNGDNSALQSTHSKFLRCHFNDSAGFAEALPGCAAQHSLQALSSGPYGEPTDIQTLSVLMEVPHISLAFRRSWKAPFWEVPLNLQGISWHGGVRWLEWTWTQGAPLGARFSRVIWEPHTIRKAIQLRPSSGVG